jgi:hypothetical protein
MAAPLPTRVAAGARFIAIILAIPLNTFLLLDFTCTIFGAFAFHDWFSFSNETVPRFPTGLYGLRAYDITFAFLLWGGKETLAV